MSGKMKKILVTFKFNPDLGDCIGLFRDCLCRRDQRDWTLGSLFFLHRRGHRGLSPIDPSRYPPFLFHRNGILFFSKGRDAHPGDIG